jgi:uncharacterized protein (TIRG00374 family)
MSTEDSAVPKDAAPASDHPLAERRKQPGGRRMRGKLIGLGVSLIILVATLMKLDLRQAGTVLAAADPWLCVMSVSMIVVLTVLTAARFLWIAPPGSMPGLGEAVRLTLVASGLNLIVPAKLGDLAKSYFIVKRGNASTGVAVSVIVMERLYDLLGLLTLCLLGWVTGNAKVDQVPDLVFWAFGGVWVLCAVLLSSQRLAELLFKVIKKILPSGRLSKVSQIAAGWPELLQITRGRRFALALFSIFLWLAHLVQLWLFTIAVRADVPFLPALTLSSLVLLAGLMPFTFAGIGVRETAFVVLFAKFMPPETALATSVLCTSRVLLPPLAAVPFLWSYGVLAPERRRERLKPNG